MELSMSMFATEADYKKEMAEQSAEAQPAQAPCDVDGKSVWLVATGEVYEGQETYTRHDKFIPLSDAELLYTTPTAAESAAVRELVEALTELRDAVKAYSEARYEEASALFDRRDDAMRAADDALDKYKESQHV